jgi:hypothetical protein
MHLFFNKLLISMMLLAGTGFISLPSGAQCLNAKDRWIALQPPASTDSLQDWSDWEALKSDLLNCLAQDLFRNFLEKGEKISYRTFIPDLLDQKFLIVALQKEAVDQTLRFLGKSHDSMILEFRDKILARAKLNGLGFSMTESSVAIEDRPAGYVRAQGHVIMNYSVMTRDDWLFLFVHEFSHYVDPNLETAVREAIHLYGSDPQFVARMMKAVVQVHSYAELNSSDQALFDQYLRLSLQRGWIAEIGAWANTLGVYTSLKNDKLMGNVSWADEMVSNKVNSENWTHYFSRYLQSRFKYPKDVIYNNPVLRKRSDEIEKEILGSLQN